jgi:hypothetical protein
VEEEGTFSSGGEDPLNLRCLAQPRMIVRFRRIVCIDERGNQETKETQVNEENLILGLKETSALATEREHEREDVRTSGEAQEGPPQRDRRCNEDPGSPEPR